MNPSPRRRFIGQIVFAGTAFGASSLQAQTRVDETTEQATALGYRHDTAKVDTKKYPQHTTAQRCGNCSFWQGKPDDAWAGCAMFGRKHIAQPGWCVAWQKAPG